MAEDYLDVYRRLIAGGQTPAADGQWLGETDARSRMAVIKLEWMVGYT